jgi:hypothetical protein
LAEKIAHPPNGDEDFDPKLPPLIPTARTVDDLVQALFLSRQARERDDNLIFVRERILRSEGDVAGLLFLYRKIRSGLRVTDHETNPLISTLRLAGIIRSREGHQFIKDVDRQLRDIRVTEALCNPELKIDTKADFQERENLRLVAEALKDLKIPSDLMADELHSTYKVVYHDQTQAPRTIGVELAARSEYRRMRAAAKELAKYNKPPFKVVRESVPGIAQSNWRDLLELIKAEGMKGVDLQRYKGLGEMNAGQLWETTMNAEVRTLLKVELADLVESDIIFSTLMGEDVENRRKFIEENALDVRNLDV